MKILLCWLFVLQPNFFPSFVADRQYHTNQLRKCILVLVGFVMITIYALASLYPYKKKSTRKIQQQPLDKQTTTTGAAITRHQNTNTQKNSTHGRLSTSHRSMDQHRTMRWTPPQDEPQPCIHRRRQRHIPDQVRIHMTHRTNTSMLW